MKALAAIAMIFFLCAACGCGKAFNYHADVQVGMTQQQVEDAFGDRPDKAIQDTEGDTWIYYNREWGIMPRPQWGTKFLFFDTKGVLYRMRSN